MLLFLNYLYRTFKTAGWRSVVAAAVCGALVILTHPEWTIHAIVAAIVFTVFFGRSRSGLTAPRWWPWALPASAPWWGTILSAMDLPLFKQP